LVLSFPASSGVSALQPMLPFSEVRCRTAEPFKSQLLKWIGNKQRFAHEIVSYFPAEIGTYHEPFLGSGAVLATLSPSRGIGSDVFEPLVEIWQALESSPERLKQWYRDRWSLLKNAAKQDVYEGVKAAYNACPNGPDLLFLCRACYGGVVRFRKGDGYMSTPCGVHEPISPDSFNRRVDEWRKRCRAVTFRRADFADAMEEAVSGDLVYCDPPYSDSQSIIYGAQAFNLERLFDVIARCKERGVYVALSIDGTKRSGDKICNIPIPAGVFETEATVNCGRSMLRRFQMAGQTLENEIVSDRLLLTYPLPDHDS
jgi:DNA adenine methylase